MPSLFREMGLRFFFFSNEGNEPVHIHVENAGKYAKFWIKPVALVYNRGFNSIEIRKIKEIVFRSQMLIEDKWNEYFSK